MGTLYLVATPIGNLEDISARAIRTLREVALIAAEDTRRTRKLSTHFDIHTPLTSFHEHNETRKIPTLLAALEEGDLALVSDAGTPVLNDPGFALVRAALDAGHQVSPIPGPSAPIAALVASGLPTDAFLYLGYLPRKTEKRRQALSEIAHLPFTLIILEAPHRLLATLKVLHTALGERQTAIGRELTKIHEEIFRGSLSGAQAYFEAKTVRGEFTLVVGGAPAESSPWTEARLRAAVEASLEQGESASQIAKHLAKESGWARRDVYQIITQQTDP